MEINLVPPVSISLDRTSTSNAAQLISEVRVQKDMRQPPVPPVAEGRAETQGDDRCTERQVVWVPQEKRPVYRVINRKTGEVICQLPSEEVLRVAHRIDEQVEDGNENLVQDQNGSEIDVRS